MKTAIRYLKTIPGVVRWLTIVSIICLIVKIGYLNQIPAWCDLMYEFSGFAESVLESVLASCIFYLIVVHIMETRDRNVVHPAVSQWTRYIVGICEAQINAISSHTKVPLDLDTLTAADIKTAFCNILSSDKAPMISLVPNQAFFWPDYFEYHQNKSSELNQKLMVQLRFLDAEMSALLIAVDECSLFSSMRLLRGAKFNNPNLDYMSSDFHDYCKQCHSLKQYLTKWNALH